MWKLVLVFAALAAWPALGAAQTRTQDASVNLRFSEQISNGPAGNCGCFALQGVAGDVAWRVRRFGSAERLTSFAGVADFGVEHTGSVDGAPYGLTLTTFSFGPRVEKPAGANSSVFAQTLFGLAHGSGSQFPRHNALVSSASSFAVNLGAGFEYRPGTRLAWRVVQLDYLRTALPNNSSNWQNNLRISSGITLRFR